MHKPIHIVIVGGGTAGWLSAAYLNRVLQYKRSHSVAITLIAPEDEGPIGVGEATIPTIRDTLRLLDIPEWQFLAETDATFKNGILFRNWLQPKSVNPQDHYYHLFSPPPVFEGTGGIKHWLNLFQKGETDQPYALATGVQAALCLANKSPKPLASEDYSAPVSYAYHLDTIKLGKLFKKVATERGVKFIDAKITDAALDEQGNIVALKTSHGESIGGDFFIDCSGFSALLIEKVMKEPFVSDNHHLLCDRAVTIQLPHQAKQPPKSYTIASAQQHGWTWEIDTYSRRGTGYVYSSAFISADQAEADLRRFLALGDADVSARHLNMRVGRRKQPWVKNCLALGLSAGFMEPLESTGIYMIEIGIQLFLDHFQLDGNNQLTISHYNKTMNELFDNIRDFLVLHYCLTEREDSAFWQTVAQDAILPDQVRHYLDLWAEKPISATDLINNQLLLFGVPNYFAVLAGMNYLPDPGTATATLVDIDSSRRFAAMIQEVTPRALGASPDHLVVLDKLRGAAI